MKLSLIPTLTILTPLCLAKEVTASNLKSPKQHTSPITLAEKVEIMLKKSGTLGLTSLLSLCLTWFGISPAFADNMSPGEMLTRGGSILSNNRQYTLVLQTDGNLVLYRNGVALWSTQTQGRNVVRAVMQGDGNFVLYDNNGNPVWNSGTGQRPGSFLAVQDDGNLVIYTRTGNVAWNSRTAQNSPASQPPIPISTQPSQSNIYRCFNEPIPSGYIKIAAEWDRSKCGNPSFINHNVFTLTRFETLPPGTQLDVCYDAPTPPGWETLFFKSSTYCYYPSMVQGNAKRIRRLLR